MADWNLWNLPTIDYPKNSQRSITAWARIGYKPRFDAIPVGSVKGEYKHYFAVWDDTQVEPIKGIAAHKRRDEYHAYLFRRRVYERHRDHICKLNDTDPDEALMFVSELMEDSTLWALESLVSIPQKQYLFDALCVTDAYKSHKPIAPAVLKLERE